MKYEVFCERIEVMVKKSDGMSVRFSCDAGRYTAEVSNGMRFFASAENAVIRVEGFRGARK